jgi:Asp-tRNA(Asn)/Glu-tRNA(Gln) amidotransferase C subunit
MEAEVDKMAQIRLKTKTATEIRRTLSRVMNMVANGEMDNKTANTIILGCNAVLSAIRTDEQQRKIDELERILNNVR